MARLLSAEVWVQVPGGRPIFSALRFRAAEYFPLKEAWSQFKSEAAHQFSVQVAGLPEGLTRRHLNWRITTDEAKAETRKRIVESS